MKSIKLIFFFLLLLFAVPANSQDNADYFPYKQNNYWEYDWIEWGYPDTIVSLSVFDSVDNEGRKIAIFDSYFINPIEPPAMLPDSGIFIIDTSLNVLSNTGWVAGECNQEFSIYYKLNGNQGDQWVICSGGDPISYEMARIREIRDDLILGVPTKVMQIDYYWTIDSTDTIGILQWGSDFLAQGFGLQGRFSSEFASIYLKGAVIDGILYGDTTNIVVGLNENVQPNQPLNFELFQNYPNPFNPNTTITYAIPKNGLVTLKVYDILGIELASLVNENKETGSYSVMFNASELPSGIYFYTLTSGNFMATKKLILLK